MVFGTDAVAGSHGLNVLDLICRVNEAGQKQMDAITSATSKARGPSLRSSAEPFTRGTRSPNGIESCHRDIDPGTIEMARKFSPLPVVLEPSRPALGGTWASLGDVNR